MLLGSLEPVNFRSLGALTHILPLGLAHLWKKEHANGNLLSAFPEELVERGGPPFKDSEMSFHEFIGIIVAHFFAEHEDCEKMLKT